MAEHEKMNLLRQEGKLVTREVYGSRTLFEGLKEEEEEEDDEQEEDDEEGEQEEVDDEERKEEDVYTGMSTKGYIPSSSSRDFVSSPTRKETPLFSEESTISDVAEPVLPDVAKPVVPDAEKLATLLSWGCEVSDVIL